MTGCRSRGLRSRVLLCAAIASFCFAGSARADEAQTQAAEALYRQARGLMQRGELDAACEKFAASHALEPGVGTLLHLGDCYERAGRFASAFQSFEAAAQLAEERSDGPRQRLANVRAKALSPRLPRLELRSTAEAPPGLQITLNGAPVAPGDLDQPLPKDEGQYEIRFSAPGYEPFTSRVELTNGPGEVTVVTAPRLLRTPPRERPLQPASVPGEEPSGGSTQRTVAWVVGGAGVALAVVAGVFTALAVGKNEDSKSFCDPVDPTRCSPDGVALRSDARGMASAATVAGVVGGLAIGASVVLFVTAPQHEPGAPEAAFVSVQGSF